MDGAAVPFNDIPQGVFHFAAVGSVVVLDSQPAFIGVNLLVAGDRLTKTDLRNDSGVVKTAIKVDQEARMPCFEMRALERPRYPSGDFAGTPVPADMRFNRRRR